MRTAYLLDGEPRPQPRGSIPGFLHRSGLWLALVTVHVLLTAILTGSIGPTLLRVAFGVATYWTTWLSDVLHNLDLKPKVNHNLDRIMTRCG